MLRKHSVYIYQGDDDVEWRRGMFDLQPRLDRYRFECELTTGMVAFMRHNEFNPDAFFLTIESETDKNLYAAACCIRNPAENYMYVDLLCAAKSQGAGSRLLKNIERLAQSLGLHYVRLVSLWGAVKFYKDNGYVRELEPCNPATAASTRRVRASLRSMLRDTYELGLKARPRVRYPWRPTIPDKSIKTNARNHARMFHDIWQRTLLGNNFDYTDAFQRELPVYTKCVKPSVAGILGWDQDVEALPRTPSRTPSKTPAKTPARTLPRGKGAGKKAPRKPPLARKAVASTGARTPKGVTKKYGAAARHKGLLF